MLTELPDSRSSAIVSPVSLDLVSAEYWMSGWLLMWLAIVEVMAAAAVVASVLFLARQTRELTRQTRANNSINVTSTFQQSAALIQSVHGPILEDPGLRGYFYDGKECGPADANREKLVTLAELLSDALEYGLMTATHVPGADHWLNYPSYLLKNSPIMREVVSNHEELWPRLATLLSRVQALIKTTSGQPSTDLGN